MDNKETMANHSNLMLVEIIYGNSAKYTQDDVLTAEIELSTRNVGEDELADLRNKVFYIGGINVGGSPGAGSSAASSSSTSSRSYDDEDEEESGRLEGADEVIVKVLMVYLAFGALGSFASIFKGIGFYSIVSIISLGIYGYGIYGLLNKLTQPIVFLIGIFTYSLVSHLIWLITSMSGFFIYGLVLAALNAAVLYFLTKPSMRSAYKLDGESIKMAMIVGSVAAILIKFI